MNKTFLIVSREYLTRIRKKSFFVMTVLGPLLLVFMIVFPLILQRESEKHLHVLVVDENDYFINRFQDTRKISFSYLSGDIDELKRLCIHSDYDAVLHILAGVQSNKSNLYYYEEPPLSLCGQIEEQMNKLLFDKAMQDSFKITSAQFAEIEELSRAKVAVLQLDEQGNEKEGGREMNYVIGLVCGLLIYFFILMYASQVLRGVTEEKTNRIVEVLLSSVKPVQLMMGKIVGVALVGLTQFAIWVLLSLGLLFGMQVAMPNLFNSPDAPELVASAAANDAATTLSANDLQMNGLLNQIGNFYNFSFSALLLCFLLFFVLGYLIYASLFAAVGAAVDNETDSQQFTLPVTLPLLLTCMLIMPIAENPSGDIAFWFSMIPLTSPIAMMIRLPSGVPLWELLTSLALMAAFFFLCLWLAIKVYRTGILMYGKKVSYHDLWHWLKY